MVGLNFWFILFLVYNLKDSSSYSTNTDDKASMSSYLKQSRDSVFTDLTELQEVEYLPTHEDIQTFCSFLDLRHCPLERGRLNGQVANKTK